MLVVVLLGLAAACASSSEHRATALNAGPLPPLPAPVRTPVLGPVGDSVVVWAGFDETGGFRSGGWVIDGSRRWRSITGARSAMHGMSLPGAVSTGDELIVMGMRCDVTGAELGSGEYDDAEPCSGAPRLVVSVDPRRARASVLPSPRVPEIDQSNGGFGLGWDGRRAWFQISTANFVPRVVGYDVASRTWTTLPQPPDGILERACVTDRTVVGVGDRDGPGLSVSTSEARSPAMWSWSDSARQWNPLPAATVANLMVHIDCQGGPVFASGCVSPRANEAFDLATRRWRAAPVVPSTECGETLVGRIGDRVLAVGDAQTYAWRPGQAAWTPVADGFPVTNGYPDAPSVYRGRYLLVSNGGLQGERPRLALLDVAARGVASTTTIPVAIPVPAGGELTP